MNLVLTRIEELLPNALDRVPVLRQINGYVNSPRKKFRRWVVRIPVGQEPNARSRMVHVELHDDGSVVFVVQMDGWGREEHSAAGSHKILSPIVESFALEYVALVQTYARRFAAQGRWDYRFAVMTADNLPLEAFALFRLGVGYYTGSTDRIPASSTVERFETFGGEFSVDGDQAVSLVAAQAIALDVLNQFSISQLHTIR